MTQSSLVTKEPEKKVDVNIVTLPDYSEEEKLYLGKLKAEISHAINQRDKKHDEFDGMSYVEWWESNEKAANSFIPPKKNKEDTNIVTGTTREKIMAFLAALQNLNLSSDVQAFDDQNLEIVSLGEAIEEIMQKTEYLEGDDEKKLMRQFELLSQGTVFVEEMWIEDAMVKKRLNGKFTGKIKTEWSTSTKKKLPHPERQLLNGLNVYLGDVTQFYMENQPFVFTRMIKPYGWAASVFGSWDRFKHVSKNQTDWLGMERTTTYSPSKPSNEGDVEIIRYQNKFSNEFQILLNGTMMLPVGFPLTEISPSGEYTIVKQILEPISEHFAYGKSLPSLSKTLQAIYDELIKLAVLKTQKSFIPAKFNLTGRVLSSRIFMPGKVNMGIDPDQIKNDPSETEGVTQSEYQMIREIKASIDAATVNPVFQGQIPAGRRTATEILEVQKQAQMVLGLIVVAASLLEKKLGTLRLYNILDKWLDPVDNSVDTVRGVLVNKYRTINTEKNLEGRGVGQSIVEVTENVPAPFDVFKEEQRLTRETGKPVRKTYISSNADLAKLLWQITVTPTEKKSSNLQKIMFEDMMRGAERFAQDLNIQYAEERFATVWGENPAKLFRSGGGQPGLLPLGGGGSAAGKIPESTRVNTPGTSMSIAQG